MTYLKICTLHFCAAYVVFVMQFALWKLSWSDYLCPFFQLCFGLWK